MINANVANANIVNAVQENAIYECAVWAPEMLPGISMFNHSPAGHLDRAIIVADKGFEAGLTRCLTLAMAQEERALVAPYGKVAAAEKAVLSERLPALRRLLTPYIGEIVVGRVAEGKGTIAEISCLLNEVGGRHHKRGESLIDWRSLNPTDHRTLKANIAWGLASFIKKKWGEVDTRDVPAAAEVDLWRRYHPRAPQNVQLARAIRIGEATERGWRQAMPVGVSNARQAAKAVRSAARR